MDLIGKQLPSVSAADNGKVLGVENGAWKPVAGGSKTPVIVEFSPGISGHGSRSGANRNDLVEFSTVIDGQGSWSGANWNDLVEAYYDGRAYLAFGMLVERITGFSLDPSTRKLQYLNVLVTPGDDLLIRAQLNGLNTVHFTTYQLSKVPSSSR